MSHQKVVSISSVTFEYYRDGSCNDSKSLDYSEILKSSKGTSCRLLTNQIFFNKKFKFSVRYKRSRQNSKTPEKLIIFTKLNERVNSLDSNFVDSDSSYSESSLGTTIKNNITNTTLVALPSAPTSSPNFTNQETNHNFPFTHFKLSPLSEKIPLNLSQTLIKKNLNQVKTTSYICYELEVYDDYVLENVNYPGKEIRVQVNYDYKYPIKAKTIGHEISQFLDWNLGSLHHHYIIQSGSFGCVIKSCLKTGGDFFRLVEYDIKGREISENSTSTASANNSASTFAIKVVSKLEIEEKTGPALLKATSTSAWIEEITLWKDILTTKNHELYIFPAYYIQKNFKTNFACLVQPLADQDLFEHISNDNCNGKMDTLKNCAIIYQIAKGVEFLHGIKITHRDLKPENILVTEHWRNEFLTSETSPTPSRQVFYSARITDLGHCKKFSKRSQSLSDNYGSRIYRNIKHDLRADKLHTSSCDVYALGILSYVVIARDMPYQIDKKKLKTGATKTYFGDERKTKVYTLRNSQSSQEISTQEVYDNLREQANSQSSLKEYGYNHSAHRIGSLKDPYEVYFLCFGSRWNEVTADVLQLIRKTVVIEDEDRAKIEQVLELDYFKRYNDEKVRNKSQTLANYISKINSIIKKSENKKKKSLRCSLAFHDKFDLKNGLIFDNGLVKNEKSKNISNSRNRSSAFSELGASQELSQRVGKRRLEEQISNFNDSGTLIEDGERELLVIDEIEESKKTVKIDSNSFKKFPIGASVQTPPKKELYEDLKNAKASTFIIDLTSEKTTTIFENNSKLTQDLENIDIVDVGVDCQENKEIGERSDTQTTSQQLKSQAQILSERTKNLSLQPSKTKRQRILEKEFELELENNDMSCYRYSQKHQENSFSLDEGHYELSKDEKIKKGGIKIPNGIKRLTPQNNFGTNSNIKTGLGSKSVNPIKLLSKLPKKLSLK